MKRATSKNFELTHGKVETLDTKQFLLHIATDLNRVLFGTQIMQLACRIRHMVPSSFAFYHIGIEHFRPGL